MRTVKSTEFQSQTGKYQDMALGEPITITKHNRPTLVLLSFDEYLKLTKDSRRAIHPSSLSPDDLEIIRQAKVPDEHADLDDGV